MWRWWKAVSVVAAVAVAVAMAVAVAAADPVTREMAAAQLCWQGWVAASVAAAMRAGTCGVRRCGCVQVKVWVQVVRRWVSLALALGLRNRTSVWSILAAAAAAASAGAAGAASAEVAVMSSVAVAVVMVVLLMVEAALVLPDTVVDVLAT